MDLAGADTWITDRLRVQEGAGTIRRKIRVMMPRRATAGAAVVTLSASLMLSLGILVGLRSSPVRTLSHLPSEAPLDYEGALRSSFAPLRRGFVRETLGLADPAQPVRSLRSGGASRPRFDPAESLRRHVVHLFTNDDMDRAVAIETIPFTGQTMTPRGGGTRESGEPSGCGSVGGTAWYRHEPARSESLVANTFGSNYALSLTVFERSPDGAFTTVGCNRDVRGAALVQFEGVAGKTYWFQIAAEASGGELVFNLEPTGTSTVISAGGQGMRESYSPSVSADGRYVAFESYASDLVDDPPDDPCHAYAPSSFDDSHGDYVVPCRHLYVRDRTTGATRLVSVSSSGEPANNGIDGSWISGNGRFVAFQSLSGNLVEDDTNGIGDIFVHDLATRTTELVSVSSTGSQAEAPSMTHNVRGDRPMFGAPSISDDGRYVAFASEAANLVEGDTNESMDAFVRDRLTGSTTRVSVASGGRQTSGGVGWVTISADGRYVTFTSGAGDVVANDGNGRADLFVHDRRTGTTEMVSVSSSGRPGNGGVGGWSRTVPLISADGRYVVFVSAASDLVPKDTNGVTDVFVRDRLKRTTIRVSVSSTGREGDDSSYDGTISRDGRYVAFTSAADSLDPGSRRDAVFLIEDVYIRDLNTAKTLHVPVTPRGDAQLFEGALRAPFLSADSRTLVFVAVCYDLTCDTYGNLTQVWAYDRPRRASR